MKSSMVTGGDMGITIASLSINEEDLFAGNYENILIVKLQPKTVVVVGKRPWVEALDVVG